MTQQPPPNDDFKRTIVLIYGMFENGNPFWMFAAVRPSKYALFQTAYKENRLDLYNFDIYGEILVFGEGKAPPDDVTLKVATMYQTDPATLMEGMQDVDAHAT